jgi:NAD(P)-dependent dehydrogenase (short-subunit alcohol dehydrogenase family)
MSFESSRNAVLASCLSYPAAVATGVVILLAASYRHCCRKRASVSSLQSSYTTGSQVLAYYKSDLRGKTFIVTGATGGLGFETARLLLFEGHANVILAVRDMAAGSTQASSWQGQYKADAGNAGGSVSCLYLDLASLASVRAFALSFLSLSVPLSGLVNNGGVFQLHGSTSDGFQSVFQTNYLSHALLTSLLLPSSTSSFRVVNVSSKLHRMVNGSSLADRFPPPADQGASYYDYAFSKACQVRTM